MNKANNSFDKKSVIYFYKNSKLVYDSVILIAADLSLYDGEPKTSSDENPIKKITIQILKKIQLKNDMKFQRYLKEILI